MNNLFDVHVHCTSFPFAGCCHDCVAMHTLSTSCGKACRRRAFSDSSDKQTEDIVKQNFHSFPHQWRKGCRLFTCASSDFGVIFTFAMRINLSALGCSDESFRSAVDGRNSEASMSWEGTWNSMDLFWRLNDGQESGVHAWVCACDKRPQSNINSAAVA